MVERSYEGYIVADAGRNASCRYWEIYVFMENIPKGLPNLVYERKQELVITSVKTKYPVRLLGGELQAQDDIFARKMNVLL
ncbi:hypothetical protein JCM15908A_15990 [Prevotella dentasini JCM 15908]